LRHSTEINGRVSPNDGLSSWWPALPNPDPASTLGRKHQQSFDSKNLQTSSVFFLDAEFGPSPCVEEHTWTVAYFPGPCALTLSLQVECQTMSL
jgi:hypothetical protein